MDSLDPPPTPGLMKASSSGNWDASAKSCHVCNASFSLFNRKRHCRHCGHLFCARCCKYVEAFDGFAEPQKVCNTCHSHAVPTRPHIPMVTGTPEPKSAPPVVVVASARALSARALLSGATRAPLPPVSSPTPSGDASDVPRSPPPSPLDVAARFAESRLALRRHRLAGRWDLSMSFEAASAAARTGGTSAASCRVKAGSKLRLTLEFAPVRASVFSMAKCPDAGPFGKSGEALAAVQPAAGTVFLVLSFPGTRGDTHQFKLNGLMDATAQVLWQYPAASGSSGNLYILSPSPPAQVFGNFSGCEMVEGGRDYSGSYSLTESVDDSDDGGADLLAGVLAGVAAALPASSSEEEGGEGTERSRQKEQRRRRHLMKRRGRRGGFVSSDSESSTRSRPRRDADPVVSTAAFLAGGALPARVGPSVVATPAPPTASTPALAPLSASAGPQAAGTRGPAAVKALRRQKPGAAAGAAAAVTPAPLATPSGAPQQQPPRAEEAGLPAALASHGGAPHSPPAPAALPPTDIAELADLFALAFGDAFAAAKAGGWDPEALAWHGAGPRSEGGDDSSSEETPDEEEGGEEQGSDDGSHGADGSPGLPPAPAGGTGDSS